MITAVLLKSGSEMVLGENQDYEIFNGCLVIRKYNGTREIGRLVLAPGEWLLVKEESAAFSVD